MNKQNRKSQKTQPKEKKQKPVQKQTKRTKMTKPTKSALSTPQNFALSAPVFLQQQRSLTTLAPHKTKPMSRFPSTPFTPLSTPLAFPQQQTNLALFNIAKRGLILRPKVPLDKEQDLFFEFNVHKAAAPMVELPDAEYPDWLWTIADDQQSLYDISKIPQDEMDIPTQRRKFKLERRDLIKGNNNTTKK